jgi:ubiquinone/menaquinone biosynthesis C-methylase UbiE
MCFLPFRADVFGAVVCMDTSLGYLPSAKDDLAALPEAQRVLAHGGVLVVDVFNRERLNRKYQGKEMPTTQLEYPSFFLQQKRSVSSSGDMLCDKWQIQDKSDGKTSVFEHKVHLYTQGRLQEMLQSAGFAISAVYGGYERQPFNPESSRLILLTKVK